MAKDKNQPVHLVNAALDEIATAHGQQIVLRGVIDPKTLVHLKVDEYQREALPMSALTGMCRALTEGESLPDLELAMRGGNFESKGDEFWLKDDVYIIDGQQRRNAALHALESNPDLVIRVGSMIHFNTSRAWERERFKILNLERVRVSPNVLLRNMRHANDSVLTLFGLSTSDNKFALKDRVCWRQKMTTEELITARTLVVVSSILHGHKFGVRSRSLGELIPQLNKQLNIVGMQHWRENLIRFMDIVDEAWGVRTITYRDLCLQTRTTFLSQLAMVFSDHVNFWDSKGKDLQVTGDYIDRLKAFQLRDPAIIQIIATGGSAGSTTGTRLILYTLIRDFLNKGRTVNRLRTWQEIKESEALRSFSSIQVPVREELEYPSVHKEGSQG